MARSGTSLAVPRSPGPGFFIPPSPSGELGQAAGQVGKLLKTEAVHEENPKQTPDRTSHFPSQSGCGLGDHCLPTARILGAPSPGI